MKKFKLATTATIQTVLDFLRKQLQYKPEEPLVCQTLLSTSNHVKCVFVDSAFQPSPDEVVGTLYKVLIFLVVVTNF